MRASWIIKGFTYGLKVTSPTAADTDYPVDYVWVNIVSNIAYINGGAGAWFPKASDYVKNVNTDNPIYVVGETYLGEVDRGTAYEGGVSSVSGTPPVVASGGSTQTISLVNDEGNTIQEIETGTGTLSNSDIAIPTSKTVYTALAAKMNAASLLVPFYNAAGFLDAIALTADQRLPFYDSAMVAHNIALTV